MWHYGLKHKKLKIHKDIPNRDLYKDEEDWYELAEIYRVGSEAKYTANPIQISGGSIGEIISMLRMITKDLEDPTIVEEEDYAK